MPIPMCLQAMELLNTVFSSPFIFNDGHEILTRLNAGDELADIVEGLGTKFGRPEEAGGFRQVVQTWPPLHLEAVSQMVQWALSKLDSPDRIAIRWQGDAEHSETVTKFQLQGQILTVEFAHPPVAA